MGTDMATDSVKTAKGDTSGELDPFGGIDIEKTLLADMNMTTVEANEKFKLVRTPPCFRTQEEGEIRRGEGEEKKGEDRRPKKNDHGTTEEGRRGKEGARCTMEYSHPPDCPTINDYFSILKPGGGRTQ